MTRFFSADTAAGSLSATHQGPSAYRSAVVLAAALLTGIAIALAVQAVGIHAMRVISGSMSPSIDRGDWIVVRDFDRNGRRAIRRGDVVLFRFPLGTTGRAIKRVVAIGGDRVTVGPDAIAVNGRRIPIAGAPSEDAARRRVEHVPEDDVFLLGDHAAVSIDSRSFGPVPETEVVGRVLFVAPRPGRAGAARDRTPVVKRQPKGDW